MDKLKIYLILILSISTIVNANSQNANIKDAASDSILSAARKIILSTKYCALITVDKNGEAHARTMEVFPVSENFILWFGTTIKSRKIAEILYNPKVTVYYSDPEGNGYVTIYGKAELVDDVIEKSKLWKEAWSNFFNNKNDFVLIKVIPEKLEIISYKHGINGNKDTWKAVNYEFKH